MFVDFPGPVGPLEGILSVPAEPRFCALVCHPHPLHGGTMHNHATFRLARAIGAAGGATLRFHFRGVGRSAGQHDHGVGEIDDAAAALAFLRERAGVATTWTAGFSFGARIALALAVQDAAVRAALVIGVAVRSFDHGFARALVIPIAAVQAAMDQFGSPDEVRELLDGRAGPLRLAVVPGATHLFTEDLDRLEAEARSAAQWLVDSTASLL